MSKPILTLMASIAALAACTAARANDDVAPAAEAGAPEFFVSQSIDCDLQWRHTSHGVEIRALASSASEFSGEYSLLISKTGPNLSEISQGGEVVLAPNSEAALASSEVSLARGEHIEATLGLMGPDGEVCRRDIRL